VNWLERFMLAVLLAVVFFLVARPALADEGIARRLAALRSLSGSGERVALDRPPAPARRHAGCPDAPWWSATRYGLHSRTETAIRDASLRYGLDDALIRSVIRHESNYDPNAVSHKGAMGLMQLMPATARSLGVACPFDPRENVLGGTRYLRRMYDRFQSWSRAVAAYNAGPERVAAGRIPRETRRYVRNVLGTWRPWRPELAELE
jgi:soluble lytic murein transglycosylase